MLVSFTLRELSFSRDVGPIERWIRFGMISASLYALFIGLIAYEYEKVPSGDGNVALILWCIATIFVILGEILVWFTIYAFVTECCSCIGLDDRAQSLEDLKMEKQQQLQKESDARKQARKQQRRNKLADKMKSEHGIQMKTQTNTSVANSPKMKATQHHQRLYD
jgi:hypothetical protein